jgi:hypothetical protein
MLKPTKSIHGSHFPGWVRPCSQHQIPGGGIRTRTIFRSTDFLTTTALAASEEFVVWTLPSPRYICVRGAPRRVSTPSPQVGILARRCLAVTGRGFTEFEAFYHPRYRRGTQTFSSKSVASAIPPRPVDTSCGIVLGHGDDCHAKRECAR